MPWSALVQPTRFDDARLLEGISREYLLWHRVCPAGLTSDGRLRVALAPGARRESIAELSSAYGADVEELSVTQTDLERIIDDVSSRRVADIELGSVNEENDLQAD